MEDIELAVRIPEEIYSRILERNRIHTFDNETVCAAIKNGTPLPKGHGRLGDLDALREEVSSWGMNDYEPLDFIDEIDRTDTIIEADKKYEAKVITRGNCMMCGKELTEGLFFCEECEAKAETEDKK